MQHVYSNRMAASSRWTGSPVPALQRSCKRQGIVSCQARQKDNPLTIGLVTLLTETLRVLGVGQQRYQAVVARPLQQQPLETQDTPGLMARIAADFEQGYIITGIIDDSIYEEDCWFADPTVSFNGLQQWKRNLALLTPFLIRPRVGLQDIQKLGQDAQGRTLLRATWSLSTYLSLPWTPFIDILGATVYTLNSNGNKVVSHVETWNVSGTRALLQMFRPAGDRLQAEQASDGGK